MARHSSLQASHGVIPPKYSNSSQYLKNLGVIGPTRMFGPGSIYFAIQYYWLLGALLPVLFYLLVRFFPRSPVRLLNAPVMLGAMAWLPPTTPLSF
jgi:hypothetical protein